MKINNEDALKKAIENHKSGNLKKAEFFYTGILKSDPNHPHANHNMGLIAFSEHCLISVISEILHEYIKQGFPYEEQLEKISFIFSLFRPTKKQ